MSKMMFLMQGLPGSGKSTLAAALSKDTGASIFSTDDFWLIGPGNTERGKYTYDPSRITEAHEWNQRQVLGAMSETLLCEMYDDVITRYLYPYEKIIIDNTNITQSSAQPYIDMARIFGYEVQVIRARCDIMTAIERQQERPEDRRTPVNVILRMATNMETINV